MLNDILGTAISGLTAAQAGLKTVSNNIANVGTPGYARERVNLSTAVTTGRVSGVLVGEPTRIADRFLEATVYKREGDLGRADVTASYLDRLQALLGQPGAKSGLPARLDAIASAAVTMTGSQNTQQTAAVFTASVQDAIDSMRQLSDDVDGLRADVESEVGFSIETINGLLARVHELNDTVSQLQGQGRDASGALNQRVSAIQQLGSFVAVTVRDQPDGRVTIDTASGVTLLDKKLRQLSYPTAGEGAAQPIYPTIDLRFADANGMAGASTGEQIDSAAVGGKLGGLLDLRDRSLPRFSEQLGVMFGGLAEALNSVSNASSAVPPPTSLDGRNTGLVASDRLGFTGAATFAVTQKDGTLVASTRIDFDALGAGATVQDAVNAINAGLGGAGTATFADGKLSFAAANAANGVAVGQDAATPSARAGVGFSQYFGLNDLVGSTDSPLVPSGFASSDRHGFSSGQTVDFVLRDASGRALTRYTLQPASGGSVGDLVGALNASPLNGYGSFSLDPRGRIRFEADATLSGAALSISADSTDRFGTGRSLSALMGVSGASAGLGTAQVRPTIVDDPSKLPLAQLQTGAAVGQKALGAGDTRGATALVERWSQTIDLGKDGVTTIERFSSSVLGGAGLEASQAQDRLSDATARRDDAVNRRDSFSGVNIDEELSQMVVLQNSYSAAARVLTTAASMYDALLAAVR